MLTIEEFQKVDLRLGTIVQVKDFPEARKPAYQLWIDLGEELGVKQSSAQITTRYPKEDLVGRQVLCVVNFPAKQIANFRSEVLVTGFGNYQEGIILATSDQEVPNGSKLH